MCRRTMTGGTFSGLFQRAKLVVEMAYRREEKLTQERLRELLDFDPATGVFVWAVNRNGGRGIVSGTRAGSVKPCGSNKRYRYIKIDDVDYLAKRLAWFWTHGRWPS